MARMRIPPLLLLTALIASTAAHARPWKDASGKTIEVTQWTVEGDKIIFVINGKPAPYELSKLSPEDQAFAKQWELDHPKPGVKPKTDKEKAFKGKPPTQLPNGDVLVKDLPEPEADEVVQRWNALGDMTVLSEYYHWKLPASVLDIAKKNKFDPASDHWDFQEDFYRDVGAQASTKVTFARVFDFNVLVKQIDKGQPLVCWKGWSQQREDKFIEFEKQLRADPQLELPSAHDAKERVSLS